MWICLNCKKRLTPKNVTFYEKCANCGEMVYTKEELSSLYNVFCGFERRHDLYNLRESLKNVKKEQNIKTAQNELWIDVIIRDLKEMENSFLYVNGPDGEVL